MCHHGNAPQMQFPLRPLTRWFADPTNGITVLLTSLLLTQKSDGVQVRARSASWSQ